MKTELLKVKKKLMSDKGKEQFAKVLPKHLTAERFVRIALTTINKTPKLAKCSKTSILSCLMDLSQLGLEPDGRKAHLIPFNTKYGWKAQLIIDYKGYVDLVYRTGEVADIHADVVYENDEFEYSFGSNAKLIHKPTLSGRGKPIGAYSFVKIKDGSESYEVMNKKEIEATRGRSKASNSGPWVTDWSEMAKKTVFRRHSKWLPLSTESMKFQQAVEKDYDSPDFDKIKEVSSDIKEPKSKSTKTPKKDTKENFKNGKDKLEQVDSFVCGFCGKVCKTKGALTNHQRACEDKEHEDGKPLSEKEVEKEGLSTSAGEQFPGREPSNEEKEKLAEEGIIFDDDPENEEDPTWADIKKRFQRAKEELGEDVYNKVLGVWSFESVDQIENVATAEGILVQMRKLYKEEK